MESLAFMTILSRYDAHLVSLSGKKGTGEDWQGQSAQEGTELTMTTKLSDLMAGLSEEDLKDVRKRSRVHLKAMEDARRLDEIRRAANKKQGDIAMAMGIGQNAVSQLEKRRDMQLSTLNRYVESVGFRLELSVVAPSGDRIALKKFKPPGTSRMLRRQVSLELRPRPWWRRL